ncbi:MAG: S-layer homology domain-containing protein [Eubacteriales bacterium]|nr:S-layer homology domain-containing protein [Eubacteriales bacterium]
MKKFLSLLLSMSMLLSLFVVCDVVAEETKQEQIKFLEVLGIMESVDPASYTAGVTRESFAYYAAKAVGISTTGNDESRRYIDVPTYSYAFSAINNLADAGIISESADGRFRPNELITHGEACTIMLNAMGYKEYASYNGEWPLGYAKIARMLDIPVGDNNEAVTLSEAADLIYESIKRPLYDIEVLSEEKTVYRESDETLLSTVFSIEFSQGIFEAFEGGAIESSDLTEENIVKISGKTFEVSDTLDVRGYFGDYIEYFYYDEHDKYEIMYMHKAEGVKDNYVIDIENYASYSGNTISYYADENDRKTKQVSLSENHTLIYNGMPLLTKITDTMSNLNKGTITLKDSNNDGKYDVVLIMDYKNFVVRTYDENAEIVYDKISVGNKLELADANYAKLIHGGEEIPMHSLITDLVLSVAKSQGGEVVTMIACGDLVKGEVQAIGADYVTIDGAEYEVEKSYKDEFSVKVGMSYVFHLDSFGKIAYVSASDNRKMKFAYLVAGTDGAGVFEQSYRVKMFTEDGQMVYLDFAENPIIDGDKRDTVSKIKKALFDVNTNKVKPQLVEFELNGDGKIKEMDTLAVRGKNEDPDYSLRPVFSTAIGADGWGQDGRYMYKALLRTQTVTFMVPEEADADDKYYRIGKSWRDAIDSSAGEWWQALNVYWRSDDSAFVDAVVRSTVTSTDDENSVKDEKNVVMVTEIGEGLNADEEVMAQITGIDSSGSNVVLYVEPDKCDAGIDTGDLVVVSTYVTNEPASAKLVYDASAGGEPVGFITTTYAPIGDFLLLSKGTQHANYRHATQISFGYAKKVFDEGVVSMSRYLGGDETERMIFPSSVAVYDSEIDEVYVGSISDVMAYEDCGSECSKLFYHTYAGVGRGVFVYK